MTTKNYGIFALSEAFILFTPLKSLAIYGGGDKNIHIRKDWFKAPFFLTGFTRYHLII